MTCLLYTLMLMLTELTVASDLDEVVPVWDLEPVQVENATTLLTVSQMWINP